MTVYPRMSLFIGPQVVLMQLAAVDFRHKILHGHCLFEGKMVLVHLNGDNHIQNFICGGISSNIYSEITFYGSAYTSP